MEKAIHTNTVCFPRGKDLTREGAEERTAESAVL